MCFMTTEYNTTDDDVVSMSFPPVLLNLALVKALSLETTY